MTREELKAHCKKQIENCEMWARLKGEEPYGKIYEEHQLILELLEQEPRKGEWLRMSDLSEQEDDRYKCSCCGNVVHYTNKMNLYTFNSWCGRCGSDNGRHINCEVGE
jgi:hypothetical protein